MERHVVTEQQICPRHDELLTDGEDRGDIDEIRVLYPRVSAKIIRRKTARLDDPARNVIEEGRVALEHFPDSLGIEVGLG